MVCFSYSFKSVDRITRTSERKLVILEIALTRSRNSNVACISNLFEGLWAELKTSLKIELGRRSQLSRCWARPWRLSPGHSDKFLLSGLSWACSGSGWPCTGSGWRCSGSVRDWSGSGCPFSARDDPMEVIGIGLKDASQNESLVTGHNAPIFSYYHSLI